MCQPIDVRRLVQVRAIARQVEPAEVIRKNENNIWPPQRIGRLCAGRGENSRTHKQRGDKSKNERLFHDRLFPFESQ